MKSPNDQDWKLIGLFAVQCGTEMLERTVNRKNEPDCIRYFSPNAVSQWRQILQKMGEPYGSDFVCREARTINCNLVSVLGCNAEVESQGCLFFYGTHLHDNTNFAEASLFRLRMTCCSGPASSDARQNINSSYAEGLPSFISALPFQLQITDFDYETIH